MFCCVQRKYTHDVIASFVLINHDQLHNQLTVRRQFNSFVQTVDWSYHAHIFDWPLYNKTVDKSTSQKCIIKENVRSKDYALSYQYKNKIIMFSGRIVKFHERCCNIIAWPICRLKLHNNSFMSFIIYNLYGVLSTLTKIYCLWSCKTYVLSVTVYYIFCCGMPCRTPQTVKI